MLMQNLGAQKPIMEEEEEDYTQQKLDKNETDEEKKKRLEGKCPYIDTKERQYKMRRKLFILAVLFGNR